MSRLLPFSGGALTALLVASALAGASADPPAPSHGRDAACVHCHPGPHEKGGATAEQFTACGSCHATEHWTPATFDLTRHASTAFPLTGKHEAVDCARCHVQAQLVGLPAECAGCHIDRHRGILGDACESCHAVNGFTPVADFVHTRTGFTLEGKHATTACADCHRGDNGQKLRQGVGPACDTCHESTHAAFKRACDTCHPVAGGSFASARGKHLFDHRTTGFPLERRHAAQMCGSCHVKGKPLPDTRCASCHVTPHMGQLGFQCQDCHAPDRWTLARFDHDLTMFPLRGAHFTTSCASCHTSQRWVGLTNQCWDCHALDAARAPTNIEAHRFGRSDCGDCHTTWRWR